jgi:hypothetical protein
MDTGAAVAVQVTRTRDSNVPSSSADPEGGRDEMSAIAVVCTENLGPDVMVMKSTKN